MEEVTDNEYPKLAVITGASTGIGLELARVFAANDYDLLLCSNSEQINDVEYELNNFNVDIITCQVDLATAQGVKDLYREIKSLKRQVDVLVVNAGVGLGGEFTDTDLHDEFHLMRLNMMSPVHLTKLISKDMVAQGSGKLLFTSSISAMLPSPYEAIYGASKAFIESFAESLRTELKDAGITVTALLPGPTNTNFFNRAGMNDTRVGAVDKYENDPAEVAQQGFDALMAGKRRVFAASFKTKLQGMASKYMPEWMKAEMHKKISEPGSAPEVGTEQI